MKIKRDITSETAPAPAQLEVGELAINAKTGILYSKLVDGTVVKWLAAPVCDTESGATSAVPVPEISFSDTNNFCCNGDGLTIYVSNLLVNNRYSCTVTDLVENSTSTVSPSSLDLTPTNKSDRSVVFNININRNTQSVALFKVSVYQIVRINNVDTNMLRSEKIIHIYCKNCVSSS